LPYLSWIFQGCSFSFGQAAKVHFKHGLNKVIKPAFAAKLQPLSHCCNVVSCLNQAKYLFVLVVVKLNFFTVIPKVFIRLHQLFGIPSSSFLDSYNLHSFKLSVNHYRSLLLYAINFIGFFPALTLVACSLVGSKDVLKNEEKGRI
jgi:hypothetical protein